MEIKIIEQREQPIMAVKRMATNAELGSAMSEAMGKIWEYIVNNNGRIALGEAYTSYVAQSEDGWDMEIGFPVVEPLADGEGVYASKIPGGKCAMTQLKGSYSQLGEKWGEFFSEILKQGLKPNGIPRDHYQNDPSQTPQEELLTYLIIPIE